MMKHDYAKHRLGSTALIVVLAFCSTPLAAQEASAPEAVQAAPADPDPTTEPSAVAEPPETAAEPSAATTTVAEAPTPVRPVKTTTRAPTRSAPAKAVVPAEALVAPSSGEPTAAPEPEMATAVPNDTAFAEPEPIAEPQEPEDLLPIAGAGLGLLALAGLGMAVRRRRSRAEVIEEETIEPAHTAMAPKPMPVEAETVTPERSAFAWGNAPQADQPTGTRANETWAERAYHGPTPDNPSLSLKKRLKRAAFFDQRERDAAAGHAAPVEADAGLPDDMTNGRALEAA